MHKNHWLELIRSKNFHAVIPHFKPTHTKQQFLRFILVGLISNGVLFGFYVVLSFLGVGPKLAMSLIYCAGLLQTFVFNKRWTFRFDGPAAPALARYCAAYAICYFVNFISIIVLVDKMGFTHQWVMAALIIFMSAFLFLAQKLWVFRHAMMN